MLGSLGRVGGRGGAGSGPIFGARLIQPGAIAGGGVVSFSRAQAIGVRSTAITADGVTPQEYIADVPRFNGTARRLLLEGQRVNFSTNSRLEGATVGVVGSGGLLPTGQTITGVGVTSEVISVVAIAPNINRVAIKYSSLSAPTQIVHAIPLSGTMSVGGTLLASMYMRLSAGTLTNVTAVNFATSGVVSISPGLSATRIRQQSSRIFASGGTPGWSVRFACTVSSAIDFTVEYDLPQAEEATFASSSILSSIATIAASTRGQDNFTSSFSSLFPAGVGTILASFMIPQNAPSSTDQMLFDISDGSLNNRIRLRNVAGGASIVAGQVIGGTSTDATSLGNMTAGTLFRVGLTFDGTEIVANLNGGTNQTVVGQPTGLTTLRVGNNSSGLAAIFGECGYFDALPNVITAANLPAAVSAIPS